MFVTNHTCFTDLDLEYVILYPKVTTSMIYGERAAYVSQLRTLGFLLDTLEEVYRGSTILLH